MKVAWILGFSVSNLAQSVSQVVCNASFVIPESASEVPIIISVEGLQAVIFLSADNINVAFLMQLQNTAPLLQLPVKQPWGLSASYSQNAWVLIT